MAMPAPNTTIDSRKWIKLVIKMRRTLIRRGVSNVNQVKVIEYVTKIESWIACWKPTEQQMRNYLLSHEQMVWYIMPGPGSGSYDTLRREFELIIKNQPYAINPSSRARQGQASV